MFLNGFRKTAPTTLTYTYHIHRSIVTIYMCLRSLVHFSKDNQTVFRNLKRSELNVTIFIILFFHFCPSFITKKIRFSEMTLNSGTPYTRVILQLPDEMVE